MPLEVGQRMLWLALSHAAAMANVGKKGSKPGLAGSIQS